MTDVDTTAPAVSTEAIEARDLRAPELYANRELSWLDFNERVLELAEDERLPLLERARFLAIHTSNLDEFFMVRVAGVHDQVDAGIDARGPDGLSPSQMLERIYARTRELEQRQSRQWEHHVRPALAREGIRVVDCTECDERELSKVDDLFAEQVFPVLTPLAVGPGRPFPYISNLSLSLAVWLRDPESGQETFARVKVPKEVLPRFLSIGDSVYVPLETAIARHLRDLFPGMEILRHDYFRVTRDADFTVSDEADDLLQAVEDELRRRRFGEVVRLEVGATMDPDLRRRLIEWLAIEEQDVVDVEGLLDLDDLNDLYEIDGHRELRFDPWTPTTPPAFSDPDDGRADVLAAMRENDLLVHHPYDSFAGSVERFVQQAVADPDVLAIKMTVYRTSDDSALVPSLIEAAERGKQAVCLLELKARFDERRNIGWARALEEAGAHVVHGLPGLKTHAKALLVVRREGSGVRHYVHVGTGNYHAKTARLYEDFGLFTTDQELAADVAELFNSLTGIAHAPGYRKAITAPDHMRSWFRDQVERTIRAHREGQDARIVLKMNSLVDARCIRSLYEASQAGVPVDLSVRGICCLRPGIEGVSENIRVVSVVGRFLEHTRIYSFQRGSERFHWIGSADLMPRNLDTRVELLAPVEDPQLQDELDHTLEVTLEDDTFGWELKPDGSWLRRDGNTRAAHLQLMERALMRAGTEPAPV
jgi:polyphosphate kinase